MGGWDSVDGEGKRQRAACRILVRTKLCVCVVGCACVVRRVDGIVLMGRGRGMASTAQNCVEPEPVKSTESQCSSISSAVKDRVRKNLRLVPNIKKSVAEVLWRQTNGSANPVRPQSRSG